MAVNTIKTEIFPKELSFKPGGDPVYLTITVVNDSDRFAGFQVDVTAAGTDQNHQQHWYTITPEVSTKKPPGDQTQFQIKIHDSPIPGFVGLMNLTVRIFSTELADEERQTLRMQVEQGNLALPLKLTMPIHDFTMAANDAMAIPVEVYNPSQLETQVLLQLQGLDPAWLESSERRFTLKPGQEQEVSFTCQLPGITQTLSQTYPFQIEATHSNGPPAHMEATLDISPQGAIDFQCEEREKRIPAKRAWLPGWQNPPVTYQLTFHNRSNLQQKISLELRNETPPKCDLKYFPDVQNLLPGETETMEMQVTAPRPWIGRSKQLVLETRANLSDQRVGNTNPGQHNLRLKVAPIIPLWLVIVAIPGLLYFIWSLLWLNPNNPNWGHQAAVNSVQLNGVANDAVSGSNDQTLRTWHVRGFFSLLDNPEKQILGQPNKAVRVTRYRPVDNNMVAAGLENGEIQIWSILEKNALLDRFVYQTDDRVLDLEYTSDSQTLFSGHGSGVVLEWDVNYSLDDLQNQEQPPRTPVNVKQWDFAVYDLDFVTPAEDILAIAGRFNQLILWNRETDQIQPIRYEYPGGKDDYIFSVGTASLRPGLMVSGDNQGRIMLWNLNRCLNSDRSCEILDQWTDGHNEEPIRTVTLSEDGCYLATGGDDGRVVLWPLSRAGTRSSEYPTGIEIDRSFPERVRGFFSPKVYPKINSVHMRIVNQWVYIASASDDTQVRVERQKRLNLGCDFVDE
ncbi:WD40 repeat domain-containing protein [Spirulina sp. CS-785/01]|uniref:WD40 repeat domain-containing protein n=1 Tax=Spirulina sp. CS-785/01 TaxID=3021716 RepID=UPI00232FE6DF|nr:WD40 repeat domain-containing protein [Spirulina sp. CS-785/01]MDB9312799.1 WD40 repeat domain-containing protein [Spirulina sp. CS-785/01]